jgi:hypothetical protein
MIQRRLSKEESRKRYAEGRRLWNEFDPIGVFTIDKDWSQDEYEGYVGPSVRIVEEGQGSEKLSEYVRWVVHDRMGLSSTDARAAAIIAFSEKFTEWYRSEWADTVV